MFRSVVDLSSAVSGHGDLIFISDWCDLERSGYYRDLDVRVVFGCCSKVCLSHRHLVGANVRAFSSRLSIILCNSRELDRRIVFRYCVSVYALLRSVVDLRCAISGYGDLILISDRCDGQCSRYYRDLDVRVVFGCCSKVCLSHRHLVGAYVCTLCCCLLIVLCDSAEGDGRVIIGYFIAAYALLSLVVDFCSIVTCYGDLVFIRDRCDGQCSRYYRDLDVRVVFGCCSKVCLSHRHLVGAYVCTLCCCLLIVLCDSAEGDGRVIIGYFIAAYALLSLVVDFCSIVTCYDDLVFILDRRDLKRSRYYRDLDVRVVAGFSTEVIRGHSHRIGAYIRALSGCLCIILCNSSEYDR